MTSFVQWRTTFLKNKKLKPVMWLSGTEDVLKEEIIDYAKKFLSPTAWNFFSLAAGVDAELTIWETAFQPAIDGKERLVVIRNADALRKLEKLEEWWESRSSNPKTYLIFVSSKENLDRLPSEEKYKKGKLVPHLQTIQARGSIIECKPFTSSNAKHAVDWVQSKVLIRETVAKYLLERCNGDFRLIRDTCLKLSVFPDDISISTINFLLSESPRDTFTNALMEMDRHTALLALAQLKTEEYSAIIGLLDSRLDTLGIVYDLQLRHKPKYEISKALGAQGFLVDSLSRVAKNYNPQRRQHIRSILNTADNALQQGMSDGVMEMIVRFW